MFSDVISTFPSRLFNYSPKFFQAFNENDYFDIENRFSRNFCSPEQPGLIIDDNGSSWFSSILSNNSLLSLDEEEDKNEYNFNIENLSYSNLVSSEDLKENEKKRYFKVEYPKKYGLFTNTDKNSVSAKKRENLLKRKRLADRRRPRKENQDNIRRKIKRGFFNTALINILNSKLESIGSNKYFEKFAQIFIADVDQKRNKEIFNMTLKEIFTEKKLYKREKERGVNNFLHNLKVIQSEDIQCNEEFVIVLNKTIRELYEEYLNSDEFKTGEINRLKQKKMDDDYIKRYIYLANHLIEFFSK